MSLLKNSSIFVVSSLLNSLVPFILLPFLTSHVDAKSYGFIALVGLSVNLLAPFLGLSVSGALLKRNYDKNLFIFEEYLSNCLYILFLSTILFTFVFWLSGDFFSELFLIPPFALKYILIITSTQFVNQILLTYWRVNNKAFHFGVFQLLLSLSNLILTFIFISLFDLSWEGRVYAWVCSNLFFSALSILILFIYKQIFRKFNWHYIKDALKFSLPLIPHTLGAMLLGFSTRWIIGFVIDIDSVGVFSVSYQFASILGVVFAAFNSAFVPWLFAKISEGKIDNIKIVHLSYQLMLMMMIMSILSYVVIYLFFDFIVEEKFRSALIYLPYLLTAFMFNGIYYIVTNYIFYKNKTTYLALSTGGIAILHLGICFIMTKTYGIIGASMSNAISYLLLFILTWKISNKVYSLPWKSEFLNSFKVKNFNFKN